MLRNLFQQIPLIRRFVAVENEPFSFLPDEVLEDDVFITSYPKSGNTWVRFLLANALHPDRGVNFHSIQDLVPEVGKSEEDNRFPPYPRLLKSHAPYKEEYGRTIYILRDGRDVYVSYYYYLQKDKSMSFDEFLIDTDHWPSTWGEHVEGWLDAYDRGESVLLVRYEDLKTSPETELNRMLSFIGIDSISQGKIYQAVANSSFESMRQIENEKGRPYSKSGRFVRKGKKSDWQTLFTHAAKKAFKRREGDVLVRAGYATDKSW